jgi:hypothetical protein
MAGGIFMRPVNMSFTNNYGKKRDFMFFRLTIKGKYLMLCFTALFAMVRRNNHLEGTCHVTESYTRQERK